MVESLQPAGTNPVVGAPVAPSVDNPSSDRAQVGSDFSFATPRQPLQNRRGGLLGGLFRNNPNRGFRPRGTMRMIFADVGQGNCTIVIGPKVNGRHKVMLVDLGGNYKDQVDEAETVKALLLEQGIDSVDFFVLSHYDSDHIQAQNLFWDSDCNPTSFAPSDLFVDGSYTTKNKYAAKDYQRCRDEWVANTDATRVAIGQDGSGLGYTINLGNGFTARIVTGMGHSIDGQGGRVHVDNTDPQNADTENEMSLTVHIQSEQGFDALITGDLIGVDTGYGEDSLIDGALATALQAEGDTQIEILGVGHHGANNASSETLMTTIRPDYSIISAGDRENGNRYGHPRYQAMSRISPNSGKVVLTNAADPKRKLDTGKKVSYDILDEFPNTLIAGGSILVEVNRKGRYRVSWSGDANSVLHNGHPKVQFGRKVKEIR